MNADLPLESVRKHIADNHLNYSTDRLVACEQENGWVVSFRDIAGRSLFGGVVFLVSKVGKVRESSGSYPPHMRKP